MNSRQQIVIAGIGCLAVGTLICLVGLGVIPVDPDSVHAPGWVLGAAGGVFSLGGLAIIFPQRPVVASICGNLIVAMFAAIGIWIAVAAPAEGFSGGTWFLSREQNVSVARMMFGAGGAISLLMLIPGTKHLIRLIRELR